MLKNLFKRRMSDYDIALSLRNSEYKNETVEYVLNLIQGK